MAEKRIHCSIIVELNVLRESWLDGKEGKDRERKEKTEKAEERLDIGGTGDLFL